MISKFEKMSPKRPILYCANPAERPFLRVKFIRWFNIDRTYVRIQLPSGVYVSVPREHVFLAVE